MRIALAQLNPTVGDLAGNRRLVEEAVAKAATERADLLIAPEMVLTGYPPMDLLERDRFVRDQLRELDALAASSRQVAIALGAVLPVEGGPRGAFHNACVLLAGGRQVAARAKTHLPTYDVFDERRYFTPAERREPVPYGDGEAVLGLTVCEDTWVEPMGYAVDPVASSRAPAPT
jgi:NAD+ synthase (glutamine-hydrolysing)